MDLGDVTLYLPEISHTGMDLVSLKTPIADSKCFDSSFNSR